MADASSGGGRFGALTAVLAAVGTGWILFLMALICADVLSRWLLNAPILGVAEMVQFSIVGIVFLQLPQTLRVGGLTRADVLFARVLSRAPRFAHALQLATPIACMPSAPALLTQSPAPVCMMARSVRRVPDTRSGWRVMAKQSAASSGVSRAASRA